ncbi:dihydrofolate reductase [Cryobacterium frigoriphilum]|uniref:Dihydrofolate reductase n=1 Tax=Cryobacterium frigoriphilum TaxID=1259150 RepID=A0A4R9A8T6_9MICO|nr:dihydrofolate reductase [Cryobacterium frigoriphilum]
MPEVAMIWAQARGGVIGSQNTIPWRLPEDQLRFKELTAGGTVVMGRRTWDSLPERFRPLPKRQNIVVTRSASWSGVGADVADSPAEALVLATTSVVWIIGGGEVYARFLPLATRLEVTELDLQVAGDTVAPLIDESWRIAQASEWILSRTDIRYRFVTYERSDRP